MTPQTDSQEICSTLVLHPVRFFILEVGDISLIVISPDENRKEPKLRWINPTVARTGWHGPGVHGTWALVKFWSEIQTVGRSYRKFKIWATLKILSGIKMMDGVSQFSWDGEASGLCRDGECTPRDRCDSNECHWTESRHPLKTN